MPPRSICLITPGHLASTPRLVKEADALAAAGWKVHVVAGRDFAPVDPLDREILATAPWSATVVDTRSGPGVALRKGLRRFARLAACFPRLLSARLAARAHHAETARLAAVAARTGADFYLGHCLAGLPAAAWAAARRGVRYGFDAEDFHDAETTEAETDPVERALRRAIHAPYLAGCAHRTAAAPLIADAYAENYGIQPPTVVLNVFPRAHAPAAPIVPPPVGPDRPARCYWFSQTVGPGRGLEAWIAVLARLRTPVELHLRGHARADYRAALQAHAAAAGLARPIVFHPPGPAAEMVRLAAPFDLGLAIEESRPLNRDLCLTNKIFVYLLAGIPQLLSPTRAQAALAPALGDAALLADAVRSDEAARTLDGFFAAPPHVAAARAAAWRLAQERYCWDIEQHTLLAGIGRATA